ncbi:hypothetical protein AA313_de0202165 [Arthrobotrys entomopaga]|nr:hypothetical protein AA313_de0202165 [Arthrobotrys entomopaga]
MQADKETTLTTDELCHILSTNIMTQRYLSGFTRRQQVCTQPSAPVITPENVDDNGNVRVTMDPNQRLKASIDACSSCESMGSTMAKVLHGGCIELFRIKFDEEENPDNPIKSLELDLRSVKKPEVETPAKEGSSDRIKLLEARMRGSDIDEPSENGDIKTTSNSEDLPSERSIKDMKAITDNWREPTQEKKPVDLDDEKAVTKQLVHKLKQPEKPKQKSKKSKKSKDVISITKLMNNPVQPITVYDRPTDDDPILRNPQPAWAQKTGNELIITEGASHGISRSASSQYRFSGNSEISGAPEMPWHRPFRIEEPKNKIARPPPVKANEPSFFVLLSNEDEKQSPLHRTDVLRGQKSLETFANKLNRDTSQKLDSDDEWETSGTSSTSGPHARRIKVRQGQEETAILLNRESVNMSYQNPEESLSAAMDALRMEDGFQATVDDLQCRGEQVAAEIEMLRKRQEKNQQQDHEIDQMLNAPPPTVKYRILKHGEPLPLAQTLDELIDTGARDAPSFEPRPLPNENIGGSISHAIQVQRGLCRQPSEQEKLDWLASFGSSSPSTISRPASASETDEIRNQEAKYERTNVFDSIFKPDTVKERQQTATGLADTPQSHHNDLSSRPLPIPQDAYTGPIKAPPGFEGHFPKIENSQNDLPEPSSPGLDHPVGLLKFPIMPIIASIRHSEPTSEEKEAPKPLIERLGDEFKKVIEEPEPDQRAEPEQQAETAHQDTCMNENVGLDHDKEDEPEEPKSPKENLNTLFKPPSGEFVMEGFSTIRFDSEAVRKTYSSPSNSASSDEERMYKIFKMAQEKWSNDDEEDIETESERERRRLLKGKFTDLDLHPLQYPTFRSAIPGPGYEVYDEMPEDEYDPVLFEQIWARNAAKLEREAAENEILAAEYEGATVDYFDEGGVPLTYEDFNIVDGIETLPELPMFNIPPLPQEYKIQKAPNARVRMGENFFPQNFATQSIEGRHTIKEHQTQHYYTEEHPPALVSPIRPATPAEQQPNGEPPAEEAPAEESNEEISSEEHPAEVPKL